MDFRCNLVVLHATCSNEKKGLIYSVLLSSRVRLIKLQVEMSSLQFDTSTRVHPTIWPIYFHLLELIHFFPSLKTLEPSLISCSSKLQKKNLALLAGIQEHTLLVGK